MIGDGAQLRRFTDLLIEIVPVSGGSLYRSSFPDFENVGLTSPFATPMDQRLCRQRGFAYTLSPGITCAHLSDIDPRLDEAAFDACFPRLFMGVLRMKQYDRPEGRWHRFDVRAGGPAAEWLDDPAEVLRILLGENPCNCCRYEVS